MMMMKIWTGGKMTEKTKLQPIDSTAWLCTEDEFEAAYKKWTILRRGKNGYIVRCKKGLWGVEAPTQEEAERKSRHYFALYFGDGEYS
jgi:hypothetical protein